MIAALNRYAFAFALLVLGLSGCSASDDESRTASDDLDGLVLRLPEKQI